MHRNCNLENVVYQTNIFPKGNFNEKAYIGVSLLKWKFKYYNHTQSFNNPLLRNQTAVSKYFWKLEDYWLTIIINWKLFKKIPFDE